MKCTYIYALRCPDTNLIRYIGKADNPGDRLKHHIWRRNSEDTHKSRWIRKLYRNNQRPILEVLEKVPYDMWQERERYWIDKYDKLTNTSDGGQGFSNDDETQRRANEGLREFWKTEESMLLRETFSEQMKQHRSKYEVKEKYTAIMKSRWEDETYRAYMSNLTKGKSQSDDHVTKRVLARKSNGTYGHSQDTKEKLSRIAKERYAWGLAAKLLTHS